MTDADTAKKRFNIHGKLRLSLNAAERILFIEARGPFNEEFAKEYEQQISPLREALKPIAWTSLARIYGDEALLTPESRDFLIASIRGARELGLKATALVLDKEVSGIYLEFWDKLYKDTGLTYKICHHKSDALSFLALEIQKYQSN